MSEDCCPKNVIYHLSSVGVLDSHKTLRMASKVRDADLIDRVYNGVCVHVCSVALCSMSMPELMTWFLLGYDCDAKILGDVLAQL